MEFKRACTLDCFDLCTYVAKVDENKVVSIKPDKNHPYTKGFMCSKGMKHLDRLYDKNRLKTPLLKVDGKFKEISFEEAVNIFTHKITKYTSQYGSTSILRYSESGDSSVMKSIAWEHFFNYLGGITTSKGGTCWAAGMEAQKCDFGGALGHSLEDLLNSNAVILWGRNPANTSVHLMKAVLDAQKNGATIITIDPISTETAKKSDYHIKPKPGSDDALAIGIIKKLLFKDKLDYQYIDKYSHKGTEFIDYIKSIDMKIIYDRTGLSEETFDFLADIYINSPCATYIGYGMQKYNNGGNSVRLIDALCFLSKNIGVEGAGANYANRIYPLLLNLDPFKSEKYKKNEREFFVNEFADFIKAQVEEPVKMAIISTANPMSQFADVLKSHQAFISIDFTVTFDMFMTDTANLSDLVIPCSNTLETEDLIYSSMNSPYLNYNPKVVEPDNILMDEFEFIKAVSKLIGIDFPDIPKEDYINAVIEPVKSQGITLESLKNDYVNLQASSVPYKDLIFQTPSTKYEFYSERAKAWGYPMAILQCDMKLPKYPYRLITPHRKDSLFSQHLFDYEGIPLVYISKKIAKEKDLDNEDIVIVKNDKGSIEAKVRVQGEDEVVYIYTGYHQKHGNPNILTSSESSDIGGQVSYHETFVDIEMKK